MARLIRNQPFCWQEKKILRVFRKNFKGAELAKYRNLYGAITEMDSDFNGKEIKYYTKTISTYSGLSPEWVPKGLKVLEEIGIIEMYEERDEGRFVGRFLVFTPEKIKEEIPPKAFHGKPGNGKTVKGKTFEGESGTLEDSSLLEDNSLLENNLLKEEKEKISFENVSTPEVKKKRKKRKLSQQQILQNENKQIFINKITDLYPKDKTDSEGFRRLESFYDKKILTKIINEQTFIQNLQCCIELKSDYMFILKNYVGTTSNQSKNYYQDNWVEKLEYNKKTAKASSPERINPQHAHSGNVAQEMKEKRIEARANWVKGIKTPGYHFPDTPFGSG